MKKFNSFCHFLISSRFVGIVFILAVWVVFSSPYFFQERVPYPSTYQVNHFPPWNNIPEFWGPVKNGAMPDIIDQIYPWRHFSVEEWGKGTIPFWNPNSFAGNPHLANFQSAAYSPFNLMFFILPFIDAWSLMVLLQPLIVGFSMYLFLRSYNLRKFAVLIGSIAFMFSGFMVVWMAYGTLSMAISVLPLCLYAIKKYLKTSKSRFGLLFSVLIAFSFFSGHFQTSLYLALFSLLFAVFSVVSGKKRRQGIYLGAFFLVGIILSGLQLVPTIQFYSLSPRSESFITEGGIPWNYLITLIAPDFYGNPVTRNDWFGYYAEWASFVGVIPLIFALYSLRKWKSFDTRFFAGMAVIIAVFAVSSPVQALIGVLEIPVLSTSNPSRIIVLFSFCLSVLAGFGAHIFLVQDSAKRKQTKLIMHLLVGIILVSLFLALFFFRPFPDEKTTLALKNLILPIGVFMVFSIASISFLYAKKLRLMPFFFIIVTLILISFDSLRFAIKWMPFDERQFVFPDLPVIHAMQREVGSGRVFGNLSAQVTTYYDIPGIEGYDPLYIERYGQFLRSSEDGLSKSAERSVVKISRHGKYLDRVLDLLGVSLIFHPIADTNQSWAYPVWSNPTRFEEVYKDDFFKLYTNKTAIPRGSLYYSYEVINDDRDIIKRFYDDDFDFRNVLILEEDPQIEKSTTKGGSVNVIQNKPTRLVFEVDSPQRGLLFLSDNYYPGWSVFVNGEKSQIYRTNYTFRSIVVPEGRSKVEFVYEFEL